MSLQNKKYKRRIGLIVVFSLIIISILVPSHNFLNTSLKNEIDPKVSANEININSPVEGETYTPRMDGFYPATYDFENCETSQSVYYGTYDFRDQTVGDVGKNINFVEGYSASVGCHAKIISTWKSHQKVLELKDDNEAYLCRVYMYNYFGSKKTDATIEFWWGTSSSSSQDQLRFKLLEGSSTTLVELRFWQTYGRIEYNDGSWRTLKSGLSRNIWYHFKIECDDTYNRYYVYINGVKYGPYNYRSSSGTGPDRLYFATLGNYGYGGYAHFIDAVGFSWDTSSHGGLGYRIGNNINPYDIEPLKEEGFDFDFVYNTYAKVTSGFEFHEKVLEINDNSDSDYWLVENDFSGQGYGTIEYWIRMPDVSKYVLNNIRTGGATMIKVFINGGKWYCQDGYNEMVIPNIPDPRSDTWHHVRVHFRCSSANSFEGLDENEWTVNIDGKECQQNFAFFQERSKTYLDTVSFSSYISLNNYKVYLDAVDYSWEQSHDNAGYYPATYGFENEIDNDEGGEINFVDGYYKGDNSYAKIVSSWRSHRKVLELRDDDEWDRVYMINDFDGSKTDSTIEFWWGTSAGEDENHKQLRIKLLEGSTALVELRFWDTAGKLEYYNKIISDWDTLKSGLSSNTWYHIKIECHDSDSIDYYYVYVDGVKYGSFNYKSNTANGPNQLYFGTIAEGGFYQYSHYIDAVGNSWDPNYILGDNRNEGLLLDIDHSNLSNLEYSITTNSNTLGPFSIIGDTAIPMPDDGDHALTVTGDLSGVEYSDSVLFTTKSINAPFNGIQYHNPEPGNYPATYGFENEIDNDEGGEINFVDGYYKGDNSYAKIVSSWRGHRKVLELRDDDEWDRVYMINDFDGSRADSTIEFWWSTSASSYEKQLRFKLLEKISDTQTNTLVELRFWDTAGTLEYNDGDWDTIKNGLSSSTWYHIKIECHDSDSIDYYYVYVDGVKYGSFNYKSNTANGPNQLYFGTINEYTSYSHYIDAIGFSWDPNYNVGDNQYEGVLLEDEYTSYEWVKYSYYNGPTTPLNGDKVFPLYDNPYHSIQLIGKGSDGAYRCSTITYYTYSSWFVEFDLSRHWGLTEESTFVVDAWSKCKGEGVKVLVIDSGIDLDHPDLIDNYKGGVNYYDSGPPEDTNGHGTTCAGVIAASDNYFGSIGVAPNVELYVARVGDGTSDADTVELAVDWARNNDMDIISMSLQGNQYNDDDLQDALEEAKQAGIVIVAPSGNNYYDPNNPTPHDVRYPGVYGQVIAVGAVSYDKERVQFSDTVYSWESCWGSELDLVAPGIDIYTTIKNNDYDYRGMTSIACPIVAGVCALILSAPNSGIYSLTGSSRVAAVRDCLYSTATDSGTEGKDYQHGWGVVNAYLAVMWAIDNY